MIPLKGSEARTPLQTQDGALTPGWSLEVLAVTENPDKKLKEMETYFRNLHVKLNHVSKSGLEKFLRLSHPEVDKQMLEKVVEVFE